MRSNSGSPAKAAPAASRSTVNTRALTGPPGLGGLQPGDAEFAAQIRQFLGIERADDIHDGQFARCGGDDHDAAELSVAGVFEIDIHIAVAALGADTDYAPPRRALQLAAHGIYVGLAVFAFLPELEAAHVNAFQARDELTDIGVAILIFQEPAGELQHGFIQGDRYGFFGFLFQCLQIDRHLDFLRPRGEQRRRQGNCYESHRFPSSLRNTQKADERRHYSAAARG